MLKPSVCIDAIFAGQPLDEAVRQVAECGYKAFEFWCWWEKDLTQLLELQDQYQLQIAACCTKFVSLVDPADRAAYLAGLEESISVAQRLGCKTLISQVGDARNGVARDQQQASLVAGLRDAAKLLAGSGVTLAIEPLNELVDHPGYYLIRSDEAFDIIRQVGSPHIAVTYDIYHQQISEGHLIQRIVENIDKIAHFHAAGNPGRHELTSGEINYHQLFSAIASTPYRGFIGLEYWPEHSPAAGLKELASWFG